MENLDRGIIMNYEKAFETDPFKTNYELIGRDEEAKEIIYRINSGSMLLIEAKEGFGKTALLKYAIDNFKGKGKVIYVDANKLNKRLDIASLLKRKPKGMILLIDNVQYLSKKNNEKIKFNYDEDKIKSVIFTTTSYSLVNFSDAIRDRIGKNIIRLKRHDHKHVLEIISQRIGNSVMLPDDVIKELYYDSENLKEILIKCKLLCKYAKENGREIVDIKDISKIKFKEEEQEEQTDICPECREKLIKVNEHWRCRNCDRYCKNCGSLIDKEDDSCPECSVKVKGE